MPAGENLRALASRLSEELLTDHGQLEEGTLATLALAKVVAESSAQLLAQARKTNRLLTALCKSQGAKP